MLLDIVACTVIFFIGIKLDSFFKDLDKYDRKILKKLYLYHVSICIIFYFYIVERGDAVYYWMFPKEVSFSELWYLIINRGYASDYIYLINFFPSNTFQLSFFTGNFLYCFFGYLGFLYFYLILKKLTINFNGIKNIKIFNISIFPYIFFLPNLHFWSVGVGKDTLLFFCIALFIYSLLKIKKNILGLIISFILSIFVRPHIILFLICGFGLGYFFDRKLKLYQKFFITILFVIIFASIFRYVLDFIKLDNVDSTSIQDYTSSKSESLSTSAGSGVDISSYPYPIKVFTFLYRPLFFDMGGLFGILASLENLIMLLFTFKLIKTISIKDFRKSNYLIKGSFFFCLFGVLTFSLILGNLGIMMREKNMFTPVFLVFSLVLLAENMSNKFRHFKDGN